MADPILGPYMNTEGLIEYLRTTQGIHASYSTISKWCSLEKIPYERFIGQRRFNRDEINRWLESRVKKIHQYRPPMIA